MTFLNETNHHHLYNKLNPHSYNSSSVDYSSHPLVPHSHGPIPYGSQQQQQSATTTTIPNVSSSSARDTLFVALTLFFISLTLYFSFFLWKKHRERPLATLYKLEEYSYSRLNQNEMEVDSVVFYGDSVPAEISQNSDDEDGSKPATLHVETDSLITLSNSCKSQNGIGLLNNTVKPLSNSQTSQSHPTSIVLQDSDEDLLQ